MTTESKQTEETEENSPLRPEAKQQSLGHSECGSTMSSPLSMLKKTRRTPLLDPLKDNWDKQKVPLRRNLLQEFQAALATDDSPESNPPLPSNPSNNNASTSKSKASLKKGAPPSDFELMSAMMRRVALLEKMVKSQAQEIEHKDKKISVLEKKLRVRKESGSTHDDDLEGRCQQLQKQVDEMENFLGDYGLIWVGNGETSDSTDCEQTHSSDRDLWQQDTSAGRSFQMNFDLVLQRIGELNILAWEGETFVQMTATGAQLAKRDPIQLKLYSNGIFMFDGPFRSYREHSTQQCMQDLMDGYFPSELRDRFPDGAPFEVHDRRYEEFNFKLPWDRFPGEGQAVRGGKYKSTSANSSQLPDKKMTVDKFLNKLPKVVIKAGRVIDIRNSLRATLKGSSDASSSSSLIHIDTPALEAMKERTQTSSTDQPPTAHDVVMLKVRSEDGNHTYILKMSLSETVGDLRKYLDKHRGGSLPSYDIISTYPRHYYNDETLTLQSCGLSTNATLLLRQTQHMTFTE